MFKYTKINAFLLNTGIVLALMAASGNVVAKEGMWLPPTLKNREADMKEMGLQIPVDKLYNNNGTGMNNAVVLFGRGCTGEIISPRGLILTNHHCGYGAVQGLSTTQNDYFAKGFWAMNTQQEIPCPGLTVTFIRKMENVSDNILSGLADTLGEQERDSIIAIRIQKLEKGYKYTTGLDAAIQPYFNGNQYWVSLTETYRDIRLVGFPPNGIGAFGGDADNWMWPRHTGDFSMFRVYAGAGNKPAPYAKGNKPYQAKEYFAINTAGYKEGDFTMVYGFPGFTQEHISSYQLNNIYKISDPIRVAARTIKLDVWNRNMAASRDVFIKYTSKHAGLANGWKKWQGEMQGLSTDNVMSKKHDYERDFQEWAVTHPTLPYTSDLLAQMQASTASSDSLIKADEYIREAVLGVELIQQGAALDRMLQCFQAKLPGDVLRDTLQKLAQSWAGFYKNYDVNTDKQVFAALMPLFMERCPNWVPAAYRQQYATNGNDYARWADLVYSVSMVPNADKLQTFAANAQPSDADRLMADPAWQLYHEIMAVRNESILPGLIQYYSRMSYLNRLYMKGQMEKEKNEMLYPDANLTLRLAYGQIKGMDPEGPAGYSYQTNLNEAVAKDNPDVAEFTMPQKLKDLYKAKKYGRWAVNGTVPIAFIADNHTAGGNSGSPVLNAKGELIGTNFDRPWEGTMSDLYFDPKVCRNISLDVRYTLFVIEKYGNAGWLLQEMKIVK